PISQLLHTPLDQVNFVACQLVALLIAFWFRIYLNPSNAHPAVRHAFATFVGVYFAVFCFGWYSLHIFTLVLLCYCIMITASVTNIHRYSFIMAMGYLTLCQINRVYIFNYGILSTDFSGPLMIITQKITTLAFQLHDGLGRSFKSLTKDQQQYSINRVKMAVSIKTCLFGLGCQVVAQTMLINICNPRNLITWDQCRAMMDCTFWPIEVVLYKLCVAAACLVVFLTFTKAFPILYVVDETFINKTPFSIRLGYLYFATQVCKPKYYFAWTLADAVNNAAGYGFNGVDEKGKFRWDLISNLNIWNIETATSFKMYIDNWNIQTAAWLKRVCYDRAPKYRTGLTFMLSGVWHGAYPGYYFTFVTAIPVMLAARAMRNNFRHFFITSTSWKFLYDTLTWIATQLAICYTVAPFVLLAAGPSIQLYKSLYFYLHVVCFLALIVLPTKPSGRAFSKGLEINHSEEKQNSADNTKNHLS
ncbi:hypothetical protein XELAEV_18031711mg, partial [Xenopus laevis]